MQLSITDASNFLTWQSLLPDPPPKMSAENGRGSRQQESDDESFEGNWDSKSEASSPPSSTSSHQDPAPAPMDQLDPSLLNYLIEHKADLNLDAIKTFHTVATKLKSGERLEDYMNHLEKAEKEAEKAKCKVKLLQEQLKKELSTFDKSRFDNILKSSGGHEHVESLRSAIRLRETTIEEQNKQIKFLESDIEGLRDRLNSAKKHIEEQRRALQQAQVQAKSADFELDRRRNLSHQGSVILGSPEPQSDHSYHIPPPPLVEGDEILRLVNSPPQDSYITSANSSIYNGFSFLNNSIPPPPQVDVPLDEILSTEPRFPGP